MFINDSDCCHPELEWKIFSNDNCQSDVASCASGFKDVIYMLRVKNKRYIINVWGAIKKTKKEGTLNSF